MRGLIDTFTADYIWVPHVTPEAKLDSMTQGYLLSLNPKFKIQDSKNVLFVELIFYPRAFNFFILWNVYQRDGSYFSKETWMFTQGRHPIDGNPTTDAAKLTKDRLQRHDRDICCIHYNVQIWILHIIVCLKSSNDIHPEGSAI